MFERVPEVSQASDLRALEVPRSAVGARPHQHEVAAAIKSERRPVDTRKRCASARIYVDLIRGNTLVGSDRSYSLTARPSQPAACAISGFAGHVIVLALSCIRILSFLMHLVSRRVSKAGKATAVIA